MPHPLYSVSDISSLSVGGGVAGGGGGGRGAPFRPLLLRGVERERKEVDLWEF